jgi:hypothetical protein
MKRLSGEFPSIVQLASVAAVPQEHALGCAVACVAARARISYARAHLYFHSRELAWTRGYYCSEVTEALARAGFNYTYNKCSTNENRDLIARFGERVGTIAFIAPGLFYPVGHFLLRVPGGWMNPWLNFPRIHPLEAGFQPHLVGELSYLIYESSRG